MMVHQELDSMASVSRVIRRRNWKWYQYVRDKRDDEKMGTMMTMMMMMMMKIMRMIMMRQKISKLLKHKADDRELDDSTSLNGSVI